jgi:hypothetical protein
MKKKIAAIASLIILASCTIKIKEIKENRTDYLVEKVKIEGTVNMNIPFTKIYEVKDESGTILCNYIYYNSLQLYGTRSKVLFIHIADYMNNPNAIHAADQAEIVSSFIRIDHLVDELHGGKRFS